MSKIDAVEAKIDSEKEWRQFMIGEFKDLKTEIKEIKQEQKKQHGISKVLSTKVGMLGILSGIIGNQIARGINFLMQNT